MSYTVKEADIHSDKKILLTILSNNREKDYPYEKRYDWLYYQNPFGQAIAWIIWDDKNNQPAGFTAVYPRKMLVNGKEVTAWNCGDFSIYKKYRTLGIALKLRKEAKYNVERGVVPFLYAHPNNRMVHVHLKAGHQQIALMKRYAMPVKISSYLNSSFLRKFIEPLDSALHFYLRAKHAVQGEFELRKKREMEFTDDYWMVCEELVNKFPVIGVRDKTYLQWKYQDHPIIDFELFNYYENGQFAGYIIFVIEKGVLNIFEIVSFLSRDIPVKMLKTFIHAILVNRKEVKSFSTILQEYNPYIPVLERIGFKYRDDATSSVISYCGQNDNYKIVLDGKNWFMTVGDRDV